MFNNKNFWCCVVFWQIFASVNLIHTLPFSAVGTAIKVTKKCSEVQKAFGKRRVWIFGNKLRSCAQDVLHHTRCCAAAVPGCYAPAVPRMFYTIPQLNTFTKFRWMFLVCYLRLLDSSFLFFVERHLHVECYWDI